MRKLKMRSNQTNGLLITFCGLDGCGKTTMIQHLVSDLETQHIEVFLTKQPTDFVRKSDIFRTYMDSPDHNAFDYRSLSLLAASDRVQHSNRIIEPEMKDGNIVISDRYFYSCLANLRARGFEKDKWIYEIAESIVKPDIAFFLDVPVETAIKRVRNRIAEKDRYIDMELQYRLREEYIKICRATGGVLISTEDPEEQCYSIIKQTVERILNK
ncbi:MAG: dTMP kinase [Clostridiales bacterium]|nr:dTMP kinase [Clostridiales bacterium]